MAKYQVVAVEEEFAQVAIDPISGAPTWPGDLDVAPDGLHAELTAATSP